MNEEKEFFDLKSKCASTSSIIKVVLLMRRGKWWRWKADEKWNSYWRTKEEGKVEGEKEESVVVVFAFTIFFICKISRSFSYEMVMLIKILRHREMVHRIRWITFNLHCSWASWGLTSSIICHWTSPSMTRHGRGFVNCKLVVSESRRKIFALVWLRGPMIMTMDVDCKTSKSLVYLKPQMLTIPMINAYRYWLG